MVHLNFRAPSKEEFAARGRFFSEGYANFKVANMALGKTAEKELPMLILTLLITDSKGKTGESKSWIVLDGDFLFTLMDFFKSVCSLKEEYETAKKNFLSGDVDMRPYAGATGVCYLKYKSDKNGEERLNIRYVPFDKNIDKAEKQEEAIANDNGVDKEFNDNLPF